MTAARVFPRSKPPMNGFRSNFAGAASIRTLLRVRRPALRAFLIWAFATLAPAAQFQPRTPAEQSLARYFEAQTAAIESQCLATTNSINDWKANRERFRAELREMLGLEPLPARTPLKPVVTGQIEHDTFVVEKLYFQSLPGFYVTANLYRPKQREAPAPTILYLSGHGPVISNGISYGNKAAYQHHGAWFARNGYVCLITDTVELGEIEGIHHGTYRSNMWWWNSRGYTPAGVEAWSNIRALDYLCTRPEVDTNRFGVTGRSGGGAYSWWVAALDDRIKAAAPVAGITDLRNHVIDGSVEGHCDCMFIVNTYRWDYPQVAALVAPRPLMIANSDSDWIFPLDGVVRLHRKVRNVYESYGASSNLALLITGGPHKDTQDLQLPVFRWFNRHLKHEDPIIEMAAVKFFTPQQLKVFDTLPKDSINKTVQEVFVPASTSVATPEKWDEESSGWLSQLRAKVFAGWPQQPGPLQLRTRFSVEHAGLVFRAFDFFSQPNVPLRLYVLGSTEREQPRRIVLNLLGSDANLQIGARPETAFEWNTFLNFITSEFRDEAIEERSLGAPAKSSAQALDLGALKNWLVANHAVTAYFAPRGIGLSAWNAEERAQIQIRRRFMLLGQTVDSMRVWDIRRAVQALKTLSYTNPPISLQAHGTMAVNAIYASVFEPVADLRLWSLPSAQVMGPDYLNVLRVIDIPQAVFLTLKERPVELHAVKAKDWQPLATVAARHPWANHFKIDDGTPRPLSE